MESSYILLPLSLLQVGKQMIDLKRASQVVLVVKNQPVNAGDIRGQGSNPGLGRSLGEGNGNPLQYSCLENPMERGAWQATSPWDCKSWTQLK